MDSLESVLKKMQEFLSEQGILLIQLLGKDDDWVNNFSEKFIGFEQEELKQLFDADFDIIYIDEFKGNKPLANGTPNFGMYIL